MLRHADPARDGGRCAAIYAPYVRDSAVSFEADAPGGEEMARRIEEARPQGWSVARCRLVAPAPQPLGGGAGRAARPAGPRVSRSAGDLMVVYR